MEETRGMSEGPMGLIGRPGESRHPVSRGWEPQACKRVGCRFNDQIGHCAAQKTFGLDGEGRCEGYEAKPLPPKTDSE